VEVIFLKAPSGSTPEDQLLVLRGAFNRGIVGRIHQGIY
jgi:hypothetical protein